MSTRRSIFREYLEALLIAVIFATFARTFVFQAFKIPSGSMEQNLLIGDHILVNKFIYGPTISPWERKLLPVRDPRHGDVVVFKFPDDPTHDFIKRCVGMPGDTVQVADKQLYIDGKPVEDSSYTYYIDPRTFPDSQFLREERRHRDNFGPYKVPPDGYFCMGDNRDNSRDSRFWNQPAVPRRYLKGRAFMIYWSYGGAPPAEAPSVGQGLRQLGRVARHFFDRTRWSRTFHIVR